MVRTAGKLSIKTIAREANVSIATVSRVMNNRSDVTEELRQRVRDVLDRSEYRPRIMSNRTINLAIVLQMCHPIVENFTAGILSGISKYAFEQGVDTTTIFLPTHRATKESVLEKIRERRCDAAVLVFPQTLREQLLEMTRSGVPIIMINARFDIEGTGYVDNDSYAGAHEATKHLLALGHRRIGFLCNVMKDNDDHQFRFAGYEMAMKEAGIEVDPRWIVTHLPTYQTERAGYLQAQALLDADPSVTAIFATNDNMAYGAILACTERGLRVPDDISVVGFDDYPTSAYYNPPLTTVRQPLEELGYRAAKYADTLAKGAIPVPPREILPTKLVVRKSTAPVKSNR
jgi:DNA-binding LacI/PurR family transcriptional regulator